MDEYLKFLETKKASVVESGFDIEESELSPHLFPFQKYCVRRALKAGRFAMFENCGLGKTTEQLEWASHVADRTDRPVIIFAPLAVVGQTIHEGMKFGYEVNEMQDDSDPKSGIWITNYDNLDNIDASQFSGVVLDECFAPDTEIRVKRGGVELDISIAECKIGDVVENCMGEDVITSVKRKNVKYAVKLKYNGKEVICSPRHPFFTQRGWVAAKELTASDRIATTSYAMRMVRHDFSAEMEIRSEEKILRDILLSEMEDVAAGNSCESTFRGSPCENWQKDIRMANVGQPHGCQRTREDKESQSDEQSGIKSEMLCEAEGDGVETFSAWGEWSRDDIAAAVDEGCIVRRLDSGICYITGKATAGLSDKLQSRFSELRHDDSDRGGWEQPLFQKGEGCEEGCETDFYGVESLEILKQSDPRLDRFRDDDGELYFIDLSIKRHPSFTINGALVHNSSILKSFTGKTRTVLIEKFMNTPYKLCCTATPSPNDTTELCNHAEFLNVMTRAEMLAMYFVHDGGSTADWRLKGHAKEMFWDFVSTWAVMLNNPADIGFSGDGYALPPLNIMEEIVETPKRDNGLLFNDTSVNATDFHKELRATYQLRLDRVVEIVNSRPDENFIIWIGHDEEGRYLRERIPDAVEVKGSDKKEYKKDKLLGFGRGEFRILVTKLKIAQFGLNYQNCRNQIYASLDFSFEATYQGIRRSYRFGQKETVNIWLVIADTMGNVKDSFEKKQAAFTEMQTAMTRAMCRNINQDIRLMETKIENRYTSDRCDVRMGDCVQLIKDVPDESIGFSIFSPPFAELYTYSDKLEDMGNSRDYKEFFFAFNFLVKELYRVMWSGRNVAVHCMDLPIQKGKEGFIGLRDFSGMILKSFEDAGFIYHSRVTIWKNPVTEMQRTKALGLLHKQVKKDAAMSRVGIPDYLMVFRKPGDHQHPVKCDISVDEWQRLASPVWMDINYSNTLNAHSARTEEDEKHVCPLQLQTINQAVTLWSNPGDTVLTPFMGIGSEVYESIRLDRFGIGFELKDAYFAEAVRNIKRMESEKRQMSIFDIA